MSESAKKVLELTQSIAAARANKHAIHGSLTSSQEREITESIKSAQKEIVGLITSGANVCECGTSPHGMVQYTALKGKSMPYFEIGCLDCKDKRSQGFSIDEAVSSWNARDFIKK